MAEINWNLLRPVSLTDKFEEGQAAQLAQQTQRQQNALSQYQLGSAQRAESQANALNKAYAQAVGPDGNIDYGKLNAALAAGGAGAQIPAANKQRFEAQKAGNEAAKLQNELVDQRLKQSRMGLEGITTPEQYLRWHEANHADPILGRYLAERGVTREQSLGRIQAAVAKGPEAFQQMLMESKLGAEKALENHHLNMGNGAQKWTATAPKYGQGPAVELPGSRVTQGLTPGEASTAQHQRNTEATARDQLRVAQGHLDLAQNPAVVASTATDNAGVVTHYNKFGGKVGSADLTGKPSASFEKNKILQANQMRDINALIPELEAAVSSKGLIDQSTGSGVGRGADIVAGLAGFAPKGAIAIGRLEPIADLVLKMVPRFEGPQSDKDTMSYKQAAGQLANPNLPREIRKAAGAEVLRLLRSRKNQFASAAMAESGSQPGGSGNSVTTPDGQVHTFLNAAAAAAFKQAAGL